VRGRFILRYNRLIIRAKVKAEARLKRANQTMGALGCSREVRMRKSATRRAPPARRM
tara:strand:+ start:353 stop:523 length:171 start_codon:yes stop_codon:yes gene_type:complete